MRLHRLSWWTTALRRRLLSNNLQAVSGGIVVNVIRTIIYVVCAVAGYALTQPAVLAYLTSKPATAQTLAFFGNFASVFGVALIALGIEVGVQMRKIAKEIARDTELQLKHGILERDQQLMFLHEQNNLLHRDRTNLEQRLRDAILGKVVCIDVTVSNFNNFLTYIPLYVADQMGFFKEENIEVKFEHGDSDLGAIKALADAHAHIAITDPVYAFHPEVRDLDVILLSPFLHKVALWGASRKPLPELRANLLDDEPSILTFTRETTAYKLAKLFADNNFKTDKERYTINEYRPPNGSAKDHQTYLSQLLIDDPAARDCDILILSEPEITWVQHWWKTHPHIIDLQRELFKDREYCFTAITTTRSWVQSHPEVAKRFLKAIRAAFNFVYALPELDADLISLPTDQAGRDQLNGQLKNNKHWQQTIRAVRTRTFESYPKRLTMDDAEIAHIIQLLRTQEYFPRTLSFLDGGEMEALRQAYRTTYHNGGEIVARVYDVHANLQLAAE
jgi:NMT1/THI5 like protein